MVHDKALHEPADFGQTLSLTQASHRPECRERRRWTVPPKAKCSAAQGEEPGNSVMRRSRRDTGKEGINYRQSFDTSSLPSASNQNDDPDPLAPDFATRKLGLPLPVHPRPATGGPQSGPDDSSRRADSADIDIAVSEVSPTSAGGGQSPPSGSPTRLFAGSGKIFCELQTRRNRKQLGGTHTSSTSLRPGAGLAGMHHGQSLLPGGWSLRDLAAAQGQSKRTFAGSQDDHPSDEGDRELIFIFSFFVWRPEIDTIHL